MPGIGPGGSTLALLGISENDDTIPVGSVRVRDVVVDTDGLPHYVESAAPSGSATVKLTFADSATPVFVDSGEQVIPGGHAADEDDIPILGHRRDPERSGRPTSGNWPTASPTTCSTTATYGPGPRTSLAGP